jgi:hypothetical protein
MPRSFVKSIIPHHFFSTFKIFTTLCSLSPPWSFIFRHTILPGPGSWLRDLRLLLRLRRVDLRPANFPQEIAMLNQKVTTLNFEPKWSSLVDYWLNR